MDKTYWLGRKRSAVAMAHLAATAEARLIHYDLAGRYSIKAAMCVPLPVIPPFMLPPTAPSGEGEQAALQPPLSPPGWVPPGPGSTFHPDQSRETRR